MGGRVITHRITEDSQAIEVFSSGVLIMRKPCQDRKEALQVSCEMVTRGSVWHGPERRAVPRD